MCTFYCPLRKKRCTLPGGHKCTHSAAHLLKRFKSLSPTILLWQGHCWLEKAKQTNNEFNFVYGACNLTKWHFEIPISVWCQLMSLSNLFLKFGKFLVWYLGCGCMTSNFTVQMTLRHLLLMPMNENFECKDCQIYSKMLRKISGGSILVSSES